MTRERVFALEITGAAVAVTSSGGRAEYDALVIAAGADTATSRRRSGSAHHR